MVDKLETNFGYVDGERANVGAYASPLSSLDAFKHAQERGSRLLTPAERIRTIELLENRMQIALQKNNLKEIQETEKLLLDFYGIKIDTLGYAGAKDLTSAVMNFNEGSVKEVNGTSRGAQDYLYGNNSHYKWISQLEKKTRELQAKGLTAYIKEVDHDLGLPVSVGEEPNPEYHGAVFWISPNVKDLGVVVMGQHHSVGEPCAKYDTTILPLEYKDIMLGPRTVNETDRAKLASTAGIGAAMIYELVEKTARGRISQQDAIKQIGKYTSSKNMGRRGFNSALALFLLGLAGCGGGSGNGTSPPPPPPPPVQKYDYSGSVAKRIANDGSRINPGNLAEVVLEGTQGTFGADINSAGDFKVTGIPAGTYKRTTRDNNGDSIFVPQVESVVAINGNLAGQDYSAIERGNNRFGVPFDGNFQNFYNKLAQRSGIGIFKWGNLSGQAPQKIVSKASTIPSDVQTAFMNSVNFVNTRDTPTFSGSRFTSLPSEFRETPGDYEIEMSMSDLPTGTTYPLTNGKRIIRARVLYNTLIADALRQGINVSFQISHESGHCFGAADFADGNFLSVMNGKLGMASNEPSINDQLAFYLLNHQHVLPGNIAQDTNS